MEMAVGDAVGPSLFRDPLARRVQGALFLSCANEQNTPRIEQAYLNPTIEVDDSWPRPLLGMQRRENGDRVLHWVRE